MADLGFEPQAALGPAEPNAAADASQLGTLGDFRLLREIGRGGMGVVYEAQQISLNRNVGLKILPFASMLDDRHIQRFKNEALAAAQLDHPHIVEVFGVGCEPSVHYYAMRYVEGTTLADVIRELRQKQPLAHSGTRHRIARKFCNHNRNALYRQSHLSGDAFQGHSTATRPCARIREWEGQDGFLSFGIGFTENPAAPPIAFLSRRDA